MKNIIRILQHIYRATFWYAMRNGWRELWHAQSISQKGWQILGSHSRAEINVMVQKARAGMPIVIPMGKKEKAPDCGASLSVQTERHDASSCLCCRPERI